MCSNPYNEKQSKGVGARGQYNGPLPGRDCARSWRDIYKVIVAFLGCPGLSWALGSGLSWAFLGFPGLSWAVLGCPGLSWAMGASNTTDLSLEEVVLEVPLVSADSVLVRPSQHAFTVLTRTTDTKNSAVVPVNAKAAESIERHWGGREKHRKIEIRQRCGKSTLIVFRASSNASSLKSLLMK